MENPEIIEDEKNSSLTKPAIQWGWLRAVLQLIAWIIINLVISGIATVAVVLIQGQDPASLMG
ncbi:MAG: hypothetical protein P8Y99_06865, partial [Calditrichaceae bacterium]